MTIIYHDYVANELKLYQNSYPCFWSSLKLLHPVLCSRIMAHFVLILWLFICQDSVYLLCTNVLCMLPVMIIFGMNE